MAYLRQQAQQSLLRHIHEVVPEEYQKWMVGMKQNVKHVLEIGEAASDPNAGIISDAMKYVTQQLERLDTLKMLGLKDKKD